MATIAIVTVMTKNSTVDITNTPDWDALWAEAGVPDADRLRWRQVMATRTRHTRDAEILAGFGWTPDDVAAARTDPTMYWPDHHLSSDQVVQRLAKSTSTAALMALAEETARHHETQAQLAREVRMQYVIELTEQLPKEDRWSFEKVGAVLGLTRQRVRMIARQGSRYPSV